MYIVGPCQILSQLLQRELIKHKDKKFKKSETEVLGKVTYTLRKKYNNKVKLTAE